MDRQLVTYHGAWRLLFSVIVSLALLTSLGASPVSAGAKGCSVKNKATGQTYSTLQAAVNAAKPKSTLLVRGTCRGETVIRKTLRIRGVTGEGRSVPRLRSEKASALTIERVARLYASSLVIRKGVVNRGSTTFTDVQIKGPRRILNTGTLRLLGGSSLRQTRGVVNSGHLILGGTTKIRNNPRAHDDVSVLNTGTVIMNGRSNIGDNYTCPSRGCLSAVFWNKGRLVMNHRSSFTDQVEVGAVSNAGTMVMNDRSSVHHNSAGALYGSCGGGVGGGVYNEGRLVMNDHSSVHHNKLDLFDICDFDDEEARGGGVYNSGTLIMRGSASIHHNGPERASIETQGGGLYNANGAAQAGVRCAPNSPVNVYGNTPDDCYVAE